MEQTEVDLLPPSSGKNSNADQIIEEAAEGEEIPFNCDRRQRFLKLMSERAAISLSAADEASAVIRPPVRARGSRK